MAENSTDMISRTTSRGVIVYASDAVRRLLGYDPAEMMNRSVFDFIFEEDHHVVRRLTAALELRHSTRTFSYRARRKGRFADLVRDHQPGHRQSPHHADRRDRLRLARHQRAPSRRGADRISGLPRRPDATPEPAPVSRSADRGAGARKAAAHAGGGDVPRPRPLQVRQRHARAQPGRRAAASRRRAPGRPSCARETRSPGWAATSSRCC